MNRLRSAGVISRPKAALNNRSCAVTPGLDDRFLICGIKEL